MKSSLQRNTWTTLCAVVSCQWVVVAFCEWVTKWKPSSFPIRQRWIHFWNRPQVVTLILLPAMTGTLKNILAVLGFLTFCYIFNSISIFFIRRSRFVKVSQKEKTQKMSWNESATKISLKLVMFWGSASLPDNSALHRLLDAIPFIKKVQIVKLEFMVYIAVVLQRQGVWISIWIIIAVKISEVRMVPTPQM